MKALWQEMAETWGHRFTSSFGTTWLKSWQDHFARNGITPSKLRRGLEEAKRLCLDWPPSLARLTEMAKAQCEHAAMYEDPNAGQLRLAKLPDPIEVRISKARPYLQTLRAACRGRRAMDKVACMDIATGIDFSGQPAAGDA